MRPALEATFPDPCLMHKDFPTAVARVSQKRRADLWERVLPGVRSSLLGHGASALWVVNMLVTTF